MARARVVGHLGRVRWSMDIIGSVSAFGAMVLVAAGVDAVLHLLGLEWLGRWAGPVGTLLIVASMVYSLRKRKWLTSGSPRALLRWHELAGWGGAVLVLVHSGIHLHAVLPWLATGAMLVTVASGLAGRHLLGRARKRLAGRRAELAREGLSPAAIEVELSWQSAAARTMKRWREVHMPITTTFAVLSAVHIVAALAFWVG